MRNRFVFEVKEASKCHKRDVIAALDIYCKTVDQSSMTDLNQIKDYIWNPERHCDESRKMFFFILYGEDGIVKGFAEFGYLPQNQALMIDYICTENRNHVLFFLFYHMALERIQESLNKGGRHIRFILTELSLLQAEGRLIDLDSNYFRRLLSNENFYLLKFPYYQTPLLPNEDVRKFSIAIQRLSSDANAKLTITKQQYLSIIEELYYSHYYDWFKNYTEDKTALKKQFGQMLIRIEAEFPAGAESDPISFVQCKLFEEGQCPKYTPENITLQGQTKKKRKRWIAQSFCILMAVLTFAFCVMTRFSREVTVACSFLTIIAGLISIWSMRHDFFGP